MSSSTDWQAALDGPTPEAQASVDLDVARKLAVEDAAAGLNGTACPYRDDRPIERHVYLSWLSYEKLKAAGFPVAPLTEGA